MSSGKKTVVVLGAGHAGGDFVKALQSKVGSKVELIVVDKRTHSINKVRFKRSMTNSCKM